MEYTESIGEMYKTYQGSPIEISELIRLLNKNEIVATQSIPNQGIAIDRLYDVIDAIDEEDLVEYLYHRADTEAGTLLKYADIRLMLELICQYIEESYDDGDEEELIDYIQED